MITFIDGDIIRYSVGFAAEGEPLENCLHSVKLMINNIIKQTTADEYEIFLTGKGNYREDAATILPYKGNRDSSHKPEYFGEITDYLINVHGATVIEGHEADDAMGYNQYQTEEDTCIASIDKDLDMIPGWHYNWKHDKLYNVDSRTAGKNFYKQLLTGDSTDNILGCGEKRLHVYKTGKKAGQEYMKRVGIGPKQADGIIRDAEDEEDLYWEILECYADYYERPFEAMMENATLLWIQREKDVLWEPKW